MNKNQLLDNVLGILRTIKEDKQALQKVHDFLLDEFMDVINTEDYILIEEPASIPDKYKEVISKIAESIETGFICHFNNDTLQYIEEPNDQYVALDTEELEEFTKPTEEWKNYVTVEPMPSHESFEIMERFAEIIPDTKLREKLQEKLQKRKPFRNFNDTIENSPFRDKWLKFKQNKLKEYIYEIIKVKNF